VGQGHASAAHPPASPGPDPADALRAIPMHSTPPDAGDATIPMIRSLDMVDWPGIIEAGDPSIARWATFEWKRWAGYA